MKNAIRVLSMAAIAAFSPLVSAALSVDSMNYPAWVERGAGTVPLGPGDELRNGDVIVTGGSGRVWLAAGDGSVIKLGQNSRFAIERARIANVDGANLFDAAFDLVKGAFRFTSRFFSTRREPAHRIDFRIGAVTAGVRGTDIWGRSAAAEDFVALIAGSIEIASDGDMPHTMDQPLTIYRKPAGQPADRIRPVFTEVIGEYALETELAERAGIARVGGEYEVVLASVRSTVFDAAELEPFRRAGYPARRRAAEVGGVDYTRIVIGGLVNLRAAQNLRRTIAAEFGIDDAWVRNDR